MNWLRKLFGYKQVLLYTHDGEIYYDWSVMSKGRRLVYWYGAHILILRDDGCVAGHQSVIKWEEL